MISAAPGTLNTNNTVALEVNPSEALSGNVSLHKVSKTGNYEDLNGKPTNVSQFSNDAGYTTAAGNNNFTGTNDFTEGTITVPSKFDIKNPPTDTTCTQDAVNICDLLAVFDSLNNRIQKLEDELAAMSQPTTNKVSIELSDVTRTSIKATASMSNNDLTITSYEFCISESSSMSNPIDCRSVTNNEYTFTGLTPNTVYYATVKAFHSSGNVPSEVASAKTLPLTIDISINPGSPVCLCDGTPTEVTFTANIEDADMEDYSFSWSVTEGDPQPANSEGTTCTITYSVSASYTVSCTATLNTNSAVKLTADTTITVQNCTTPTITTCETDSTVTVMSVTGNPSFIDWNDGTTGTSVSANSTSPTTHKYGELGVYTITVSKDGCSYGHKVALGDAALYPCSVSAAHTSTTDYTGSSTTPGTGGLETVNSDGKITHVADQDGNVYPVVQIGSQCWMAKNLRTTHFSDGVEMTLTHMVQNNTYNDIKDTPYRYTPVLGMEYLSSWGYYYNWKAASYGNTSQGICPKGWHLPSKEEWETMATVVNGSEVVFPYSDISVQLGTLAGKLSSGCIWHPILSQPNNLYEHVGDEGAPGDYNNPERNASGFSSIPAGWVGSSTPGWSTDNTNAYYWTSTFKPYNTTSAYAVWWNFNYNGINCVPMPTYQSASSVRCVRDETALTSYPTLSVTPSATSLLLCPGTPETVTYTAAVTVNGLTTNEGYTYTWKVTNLKTNTTETLSNHSYEVTIPYSDSANYKVTCVAKSNTTTDSAKNSVMTLVKIKVAPSFTPSVSGFTVTLNDLSYVNTVKWTSNGEVVDLPNPATHTYDGVGTYQITAYSAVNCPYTQEVEIEASVVLTASNNTTICPNGSTTVTYTASVDGATATGYSWELTSGNTGGFSPAQGTSSPFEVTYTTAGTYTYSCTATLEGGGSLSKEITTTITESEAPVFTTCVDGKWLTVSGMSNVATVHWTLSGSGETVAANAPLKSHKYGDNESTYSVKAVSSNGCETTASGDLGTAPSTNCRVTTVGQDNEEYDGDRLLRVKDKATNETNWYSVVQIGSQCWMAENLRAWASIAPDPNNNNPEYRSKFGRLYNRETALTYCPTGWHLPSLAEWEQMESVVAGSTISHSSTTNYVGTHAGLLAGVCDWTNSDVTSSPGNNAQNTNGFRVLPAGSRVMNASPADYPLGQYASFWCSDDGGVAWTMKYDQAGTMKESVSTSGYYISVRCVRDEAAVVPTPTLTVAPNIVGDISFCPNASQSVTYTASLTLDNEPITSGYSYVWSVTSTDAEGFTNIEQQSTGTTPSLEINYTIPGHYTVSCTATSSTTSCSTDVNTTVALKDAPSFTVSKTGLQVTLNGLPSENTTITWTATGTPEDLASNPHTYDADGTYKITVTNTETGCSASADVTVPLVLSITPNGTAGICTGGSTEITYTAKVYDNGNEQPADNYTYQWSVTPSTDNVVLSGTGATVTVTYSATGTYAVSCTANAETGSASRSVETIITALSPTFTQNSVNVNGDTVRLTGLTNATQVNWGDGNTNGDSSHIYTGTPGEHYYTIVAINTNFTPNCSTTVATDVQVTIPSSGGGGQSPTIDRTVSCVLAGTADTVKTKNKSINTATYSNTNNVIEKGHSYNDGNIVVLDSVSDYEGHWYEVVQIGTQCWLKENMRATRYSFNPYTQVTSYTPNGNESNVATYGLLYNCETATNGTYITTNIISTAQGICPSGWHVPSDYEWINLLKSVNNNVPPTSNYVYPNYYYSVDVRLFVTGDWTNNSSTSCGTGYPCDNDPEYRNKSGFSARPAGFVNPNPYYFGAQARFWSSYGSNSDRHTWLMKNDNQKVAKSDFSKTNGASVRCVRD